jgi:hypothetical protein
MHIFLYRTIPLILKGSFAMVSEGRGRLFRRKDGKYLLYVPVKLAEDSMFPFKNFTKTKRGADAVLVKVSFKGEGRPQLVVEQWKKSEES